MLMHNFSHSKAFEAAKATFILNVKKTETSEVLGICLFGFAVPVLLRGYKLTVLLSSTLGRHAKGMHSWCLKVFDFVDHLVDEAILLES